MTKAKKAKLKMHVYAIVAEAVEQGIALGVNRADKHADDVLTEPQRERVKEAVHLAVMNELCDVVNFDT